MVQKVKVMIGFALTSDFGFKKGEFHPGRILEEEEVGKVANLTSYLKQA